MNTCPGYTAHQLRLLPGGKYLVAVQTTLNTDLNSIYVYVVDGPGRTRAIGRVKTVGRVLDIQADYVPASGVLESMLLITYIVRLPVGPSYRLCAVCTDLVDLDTHADSSKRSFWPFQVIAELRFTTEITQCSIFHARGNTYIGAVTNTLNFWNILNTKEHFMCILKEHDGHPASVWFPFTWSRESTNAHPGLSNSGF
jgi:hypothetical protein